jgi:cytochrome c oxidase subunit II
MKRFFLFIAVGVMLLGCGTPQQSALDAAGTQAARIERLWWATFIVLTAVFVLVVAFIAGSVRRGRGGSEAVPEREVVSAERDRKMSRVVLVLVALVVIVEFAFLVGSAFSTSIDRSPQSKNPIEVQVVAHQWWWEFRYSSPNPSQMLLTANELHLPAGVPVLIKTSSADVVHSFWVPNIAGKRDLIPGYQTAFWIQAEKEGVYRGQCAEFCGHQHAHMSLHVVVEPLEKFNGWLDAQRKPAADPGSEQARRGQQTFLASPCVTCHTVRGHEAAATVGPDLTHLGSRQYIAAGTLSNNREHLLRWVGDAQSVKPGTRMPTMALPQNELEDIVMYLESLK